MGISKTFGWLEVDRIAEGLAAANPSANPLSVKFVDLRRMVQNLPGFHEQPGHPVNEKILETIQMLWHEEFEDLKTDEDD